MRLEKKIFFILIILVSAISVAFGDTNSQLLYTPAKPKAEFNQYARTLNGRRLTTFEHLPADAKEGAAAPFIIRFSDTHGSTCSTMGTVNNPLTTLDIQLLVCGYLFSLSFLRSWEIIIKEHSC
ncbi:hypothetical protein INT43_005824 [Umbelopsis isabellina]|uniref:Uncharacterized protein n=1 Tax=Mortierella isabellina TaxID=91625 RepID=A0A8H7PK89_MORIS|nr:hypothetical protein INT43_005824 [Umbelopsis isabellina]